MPPMLDCAVRRLLKKKKSQIAPFNAMMMMMMMMMTMMMMMIIIERDNKYIPVAMKIHCWFLRMGFDYVRR